MKLKHAIVYYSDRIFKPRMKHTNSKEFYDMIDRLVNNETPIAAASKPRVMHSPKKDFYTALDEEMERQRLKSINCIKQGEYYD